VDGIPWSFVDEELRKTFESCGKVLDARVARRRDGKSDGWGTVTYRTLNDMQRAIRDMDGAIIQGGGLGKTMTLVVTEDRK
jgi:RNA recognition motif-containing protein